MDFINRICKLIAKPRLKLVSEKLIKAILEVMLIIVLDNRRLTMPSTFATMPPKSTKN
jgi:hypothetical protein